MRRSQRISGGKERKEDVLPDIARPANKRKRVTEKRSKPFKDQGKKENPEATNELATKEADTRADVYLEISIPDPRSAQHTSDSNLALCKTTPATAKKSLQGQNHRLRTAMRQVHMLGALAGAGIRSKRCNEPAIQSLVLSICPIKIQQFLEDDPRTLVNALSMASNWWKNNFGLRIRRDVFGAARLDLSLLRKVLLERQGYEEELVLLFCALLRSLGLHTRLVESLEMHPLKPDSTEGNLAEEKNFVYIPRHWVEVYQSIEKRWIPVDAVRGVADCRKSMEFGTADTPIKRTSSKTPSPLRQHVFIIAVGAEGGFVDVTRRYCSRYYGQTLKLRFADEAPFQRALVKLNNRLPVRSDLLYDEEAELEAFTASEPMPESLAGYHMHGKYILENKLKKYEVFYPSDEPVVSSFKGINVRYRRDVKKVRSKEAWFTQFARVLKEASEPVKVIQLPKKKKRGMLAPGEDEYEPGAMQPLYGEWQTEQYVPAEPVDGRVPRNSHGNIDLFQPEMLPRGCAYIPYRGVWRSARELGIDYADACVGFAFHGRMAVPSLQGIVTCKENESRILAHYFHQLELDLASKDKLLEKKELLRKRREALSHSISERLREEYGSDEQEPNSATVQSAFAQENAANDDEFTF